MRSWSAYAIESVESKPTDNRVIMAQNDKLQNTNIEPWSGSVKDQNINQLECFNTEIT